MTAFLTPEDLHTLTGTRQRARQVTWLRDRGWIFETTFKGDPIVLRAYCDARMGAPAGTAITPTAEPRFDAITRPRLAYADGKKARA